MMPKPEILVQSVRRSCAAAVAAVMNNSDGLFVPTAVVCYDLLRGAWHRLPFFFTFICSRIYVINFQFSESAVELLEATVCVFVIRFMFLI